MKVKCVRLVDAKGAPVGVSPWLTLGKVYAVLSLSFSREQGMQLRLIGDEGNGVAIFKMEEFEIVNGTIPPTWITFPGPKDTIQFAPEPWTERGFWERYYDKDPAAVRIFDGESRKILAAAD
jgi:hypothetical protein